MALFRQGVPFDDRADRRRLPRDSEEDGGDGPPRDPPAVSAHEDREGGERGHAEGEGDEKNHAHGGADPREGPGDDSPKPAGNHGHKIHGLKNGGEGGQVMLKHGLFPFRIQKKKRLRSAKIPIPLGNGMEMNFEKTARMNTVTRRGERITTHFLRSPRMRMNART